MTTIPATDSAAAPARLSWRFPATFWFANVAELFERAAFYGMFATLSFYLSQKVGFSDVGAGWVAAGFSFTLYFLPPFMGSLADKFGFRVSLLAAFLILAVGYGLLGALQLKSTTVVALLAIAVGGAIVKPVITGTAAKCSDVHHRARAFSIFYLMVNIGAFLGKTVAAPLRTGFDLPGYGRLELGLVYINYYAALMAACAFVVILLAYRNPDREGTGKPFSEVVEAFLTVVTNIRFLCLILIVAGFWAIQGQLYASVPKFLTRLVGPDAKPEWLANINPFVVVCCVVPVTHIVRNVRPERSILVALLLISCSAFVMALSAGGSGRPDAAISVLGLFTLHPVTAVAVLGIALQGFAECFLSPKFMEYASKQAPRGQEGLYLGFQNLPTCIAWLFGSIVSGYLLDAFCPDPEKLKIADPAAYAQWQAALVGQAPMPAAFAGAHLIWYFFVGVGLTAFAALVVFNVVTIRIDRKLQHERENDRLAG